MFLFLVVAMAGRELPRAAAVLNTGGNAGASAAPSRRTSSARATRGRQVDPYLRRAFEKGGMYEGLQPEDEVIEQRDQRTKTFRKPDGTATAVIGTGSLHYQDTEGNWQDIDPRVGPSKKPGFALENSTNTFNTYFPAGLHSGQGVRVEVGGQSITVAVNPSLVLIDGNGETTVIERAKRSEPMAVQNKVTYPRVTASADNEFIVGSDWVKNNLVLRRMPQALDGKSGLVGYSESISLPDGWSLSSGGQTIDLTEGEEGGETVINGALNLVDNSGTSVATFPQPLIYDASAMTAGLSRANATQGYFVVRRGAGGTQITSCVPVSWLAGRQFPVAIDPTMQFLNTSSQGSWTYSCSGCSCDSCNPPIPPPPAYNPGQYVSPLNSYNHSGSSYAGWFSFDVSSMKGKCITDTQFKSLRVDHISDGTCRVGINLDVIYVPVAESGSAAFGNAIDDTSHKLTTITYAPTDCAGPTNDISTDASGVNINTVISNGGTFTVGMDTPDNSGVFVFFIGPILYVTYDDTEVVTPGSVPGGVKGKSYSQQIGVSGDLTGTVTYSASGAFPGGLTLSSSGLLSATSITQAGTFSFTVTATIAGQCQIKRDYTLVVCDPAMVPTPASLPTGTAGASYSSGTFGASTGTAPFTFTLQGALPAGVTFAGGNHLSGTPSQTGTFPITVTATDKNGCSGSSTYQLVINCQQITVSSATLTQGTAGVAYSGTFGQSGGLGTITLTESGTLPTGITFSNGTLSGTPTQTGSFPISVTASDKNGCTGTTPYTLVVVCPTITVSPSTISQGTAGVAYSTTTFGQTSGVGSISFSEAGTLPDGMTFANGVLSGIPLQTGNFPITVTATDQNGCKGGRDYTLTIICPTIAVSPNNVPMAVTNVPYGPVNFNETSGVGAIKFTSTSLPAGLSLSTAGVLSGTPTTSGTFPITVTATDQNQCQGSVNVSLFIDQAPVPKCHNVTVSAGPACSASASIDNGSFDPDGADTIVLAQSPPSPYPLGNTLVTLIVTDNHNVARTCQATVTVVDTTLPAMTVPADIVTHTDPGLCTAVVQFAQPVVSDNCSGPGQIRVVCAPPSGSVFPKGQTTVNCTAVDLAGNQTTGSFKVTVLDQEPPKITCPADIVIQTLNLLDQTVVVRFSPVVTDNCPGVSFVCYPPSGSSFSRGTTTVTCTATDASGNQSVCTFKVTVFDICLQDVTTGDMLKYNSVTGAYQFISCRTGLTISGTGQISLVGSLVWLTDNQAGWKVTANFMKGQSTGSAIITMIIGPGITQQYRINSTGINPTCQCPPR